MRSVRTYRPVDLPELRAEMAQWAESPNAAEHWAKVGKDLDPGGEYSALRGLSAPTVSSRPTCSTSSRTWPTLATPTDSSKANPQATPDSHAGLP
jgi:hypothetical protein